MKKIKVLSLCDGISTGYVCLSLVFGRTNIEYHAVEIDPSAIAVSDSNFADIERPFSDVNLFLSAIPDPNYDMVILGPPCTTLSSQGKRTGFDGESGLFYECAKIVKRCLEVNPECKFLMENVASMENENRDEISRVLGVQPLKGDSGLLSPQGRVRYYWFNWPAGNILHVDRQANNYLDEDGLHLVAFTKSNRNKVGKPAIVVGRQRTDGKAATLTTGDGCRGQSTINIVITKSLKTRKLSVSEASKLQGLGGFTFEKVRDSVAYSLIGNAWETIMVTTIFSWLKQQERK